MCVRFLARLVVVFFFLLSSLQRLSAAEPGDLISTSHVGSYSVSALEALNDEFYQLSLELWDNLLPAYADGTLTGLTW